MVNCKYTSEDIQKLTTDAIVIPCFEDEKENKLIKSLNKEIQAEYERLRKNKIFTAKQGKSTTISTLNTSNTKNIILIGLGKQGKLEAKYLRRASNTAHKIAKKLRTTSYTSFLATVELNNSNKESSNNNKTNIDFITAEAIYLAAYDFKKYKSKDEEDPDNYEGPTQALIYKQTKSQDEAQLKKASIVAEATNYARDLINTSPSEVYPEFLASEALKLKSANTKVTVLDEKELKKIGANTILAVGQGSVRPPRLVIIDYNPKQKDKKETVAIVGKGITFDSGGLNIKPGAYMESMKCDMSGAAAALSTLKAVQKLNIKQRIYAVLACAENMPDGNSYRPDDVITSYSKKTIEIGNTDAEGRLVLADALTYTEKNLKPNKIIDFATLTGACVVALGYETSGLMTTNEELATELLKAGQDSDDLVWRLPLWKEYKKYMKSSIADVRNISSIRGAGAITAAIFLQHFVKETPWAHIDIAGPAFLPEAKDGKPKNATGVGVRLMLEYLSN